MVLSYIKSLDGVRGYAAMMVVVFHFFFSGCADHSPHLALYQKITEFGQHGVSLFFVLSGFVITRILIKSRKEKDYFSKFYIRRTLRIFPLYYLYLVFSYFLTPLLFNQDVVPFKLQLPYYFYFQNFNEILDFQMSGPGHFWSLAVEEHFYLLWPTVLFFMKPKHLWKVIAVSILLIFVLKYYMLVQGYSINYFTFTRIDQILMGSVLALLEVKNFFAKKNASLFFCIVALSILPISLFVYIMQSGFPFLKEMMKYTLLGIFFFSVIGIIIANPRSKIMALLFENKLMQYFGKLSYGIYVWHMFVIAFLKEFLFFENILLDLVLLMLLTVFISHLSYYYFEEKFLKLKDKLTTPTIVK